MAIKTPCLFCGMRIVLVAQEWQHVATGSRFCSVLDSDNRQATPAGDDQTVVNDLANRYEAAMHRIDELENDLRIANEAALELLGRARARHASGYFAGWSDAKKGRAYGETANPDDAVVYGETWLAGG